MDKKYTIIVIVLILPFLLSMQTPGTGDDSSWVEKTMKKMTLEEKVGQMFIAPARGYFPTGGSRPLRDGSRNTLAEFRHNIENNHIGGFRLYGGEVVQTAVLVNRLQSMSKIPLFFSSDVEAGLGREFQGGTQFPTLMSIGASGSEELSYQMGRATALEARAIGLNMVQSPVLDVNNNPQNPIINYRSFGEDPNDVGRLGAAFIRGVQEHGAISTVKHFPGHGDTDMDSHIELPVVSHDRARIDSVELVPFHTAIQEKAGAVMVAHMGMPRINSEIHEETGMPMPATLSTNMLEGLLRSEMGYDGLIITDALWMGGITRHFSPGEAAVLAIKAGNDLLLSSENLEEAIHAILEAVRSGEISENRIDRSVARILSAKKGLELHNPENRVIHADTLFELIGTPDVVSAARAAAASGITLIQNRDQTVPVQSNEKMEILNVVISDQSVSEDDIASVRAEMEKLKLSHKTRVLSQDSDSLMFRNALEAAGKSDVIICHAFFRIRAYQGHVELSESLTRFFETLQNGEASVIIVSYGNPYLIGQMPETSTYLTAFGTAPVVQEAVVNAIFGLTPITGKMPVSLPGYFNRGDGISTQ